KTRSRGASMTRVATISRSPCVVGGRGLAGRVMFLLLFLQLAQIVVQAVVALFPEAPVVFEPVAGRLKGGEFEPAGAPLRLAPAGDEAGPLEHLEVLGHGGQGHLERGSEFRHRRLPIREAEEDLAAGGVGECREGAAELVCDYHS